MGGARRFEELEAWRAASELAVLVYRITAQGALAQDYPLRDQLRRAALSAPANIAEGFERSRPGEFHQFLSIAKGSAGEIRALLSVAVGIGYVTPAEFEAANGLALSASRLIGALRRAVGHRLPSRR